MYTKVFRSHVTTQKGAMHVHGVLVGRHGVLLKIKSSMMVPGADSGEGARASPIIGKKYYFFA